MNITQSNLLLLFCGCLVVAFRLFYLVRRLWNYPLNHGPGFFQGVEVGSGFYGGPGIRWLKSYRVLLLAQHAILVVTFLVLVVTRRWADLPVLAPIDVASFFSMFGGFLLWTRRTLGANPPKLSEGGVALETRRLGDYLSWPLEALLLAVITASWLLLLREPGAELHWQWPVLMTYVVVGLLPGKIILVRNSFPLPPERTADHQRWQEAYRRHSLRVLDSMGLFFAALLGGYAVQHGLPVAKTLPWLRWFLPGVAIGFWMVMAAILIRGSGRLTAMGRDLRPAGSWSGPFRPARLMLPGGLTWSLAYCAGLVALLLFLRF